MIIVRFVDFCYRTASLSGRQSMKTAELIFLTNLNSCFGDAWRTMFNQELGVSHDNGAGGTKPLSFVSLGWTIAVEGGSS